MLRQGVAVFEVLGVHHEGGAAVRQPFGDDDVLLHGVANLGLLWPDKGNASTK